MLSIPSQTAKTTMWEPTAGIGPNAQPNAATRGLLIQCRTISPDLQQFTVGTPSHVESKLKRSVRNPANLERQPQQTLQWDGKECTGESETMDAHIVVENAGLDINEF